MLLIKMLVLLAVDQTDKKEQVLQNHPAYFSTLEAYLQGELKELLKSSGGKNKTNLITLWLVSFGNRL